MAGIWTSVFVLQGETWIHHVIFEHPGVVAFLIMDGSILLAAATLLIVQVSQVMDQHPPIHHHINTHNWGIKEQIMKESWQEETKFSFVMHFLPLWPPEKEKIQACIVGVNCDGKFRFKSCGQKLLPCCGNVRN